MLLKIIGERNTEQRRILPKYDGRVYHLSGKSLFEVLYLNDLFFSCKLYQELPWVEYKNKGDVSGRYPVYYHNLTIPNVERPVPPRAFLYFYINEIPEYPEKECRDRGCWIISKKILIKTSSKYQGTILYTFQLPSP